MTSGTLYMYADDTTVYCVGDSIGEACQLLNKALHELNVWCESNSLTSHSAKCEAMPLHKGSFIGPRNPIVIGDNIISWVCHARLLGVTVDHKLTWSKHLTGLKKSYVAKLYLLKRSSFLGRRELLDLYFKIILIFITYAILIWGNCKNLDHIKALDALHRRAGRLIYSLPWDTPSEEIMEITK